MTPQQLVARNFEGQSIAKRGRAGRMIAYQVLELSRQVCELGDLVSFGNGNLSLQAQWHLRSTARSCAHALEDFGAGDCASVRAPAQLRSTLVDVALQLLLCAESMSARTGEPFDVVASAVERSRTWDRDLERRLDGWRESEESYADDWMPVHRLHLPEEHPRQ